MIVVAVSQDVAVTMCFVLSARAFKHDATQRPSALELVEHVEKLMQDLASRELD